MAERSYTSREKLDQYGFHPGVTVMAPLVCILLQAMLPKTFPWLIHIDLPLLAVIFFAVSRRSPIAGTVTGTLIGLFQDGLTNHPFGIFGIAKGLIGYCAASIGLAIGATHPVNPAAMAFVFTPFQSALLYFIQPGLLGDHSFPLMSLHQLIAAAANTL